MTWNIILLMQADKSSIVKATNFQNYFSHKVLWDLNARMDVVSVESVIRGYKIPGVSENWENLVDLFFERGIVIWNVWDKEKLRGLWRGVNRLWVNWKVYKGSGVGCNTWNVCSVFLWRQEWKLMVGLGKNKWHVWKKCGNE